MKIANILNSRADKNTAISSLLDEILANARTTSGQALTSDPNELFHQLEDLFNEHLNDTLTLSEANRATMVTFGDEEICLADLVLLRQNFKRKSDVCKKILKESQGRMGHWRRSDTTEDINVDTDMVNAKIKEYASQIREIDNLIQSANWTTEL